VTINASKPAILQVAPANEPSDILFSRLGQHGFIRSWTQFILVNIAVALVLVFFTTPIALWSGVREIAHVPGVKGLLGGVWLRLTVWLLIELCF
jgi:hypothetical protein